MSKMRYSEEPMVCDLITEDVWIHIFKRLSVKTLGQLRCVCKEWKSIIESPCLLLHHRRHQNSSSNCILLKRFGHTFFLYDQGCPFDRSTILTTLPLYFFSFTCHYNRFNLVDAIHGVVCLSSSCESPWDGVTVLYNPTMGKYVLIPDSPFVTEKVSTLFVNKKIGFTHSVGFGYNSIEYDFYVIRLCLPVYEGKPIVYYLYSVKQSTWRRKVVRGFEIKPTKVISFASFFMNGTIHWIVSESASNRVSKIEDCSLLMFHCELKEFKVMKTPKSFCRWVSEACRQCVSEARRQRHELRGCITKPSILKFRGMLALIVHPSDVWVMEEYGVMSTLKILHLNEDSAYTNVHVVEESLFLMNVKTPSAEEHDIKDGKLSYVHRRLVNESVITLADFHV